MEQHAINQRLNFIAEKLADSTRAFGLAIGDNSSNTHKYLKGNTRPSPEYLEKVVLRFRDVNARWLLTGEGDAFASEMAEDRANHQLSKKNTGNIIGTNNGTATVHNLADCEKDLQAAQEKIQFLTDLITSKQKLIDSQQKIISLFAHGQLKP